MRNRFENKVAVVTGAAQGIGRRVVELMAAEGAHLLLVDRSEIVHEVADALKDQTEVLALTADLEKFAECQRVMDAAKARFGRIDILVNNVGGTIWTKPFEFYAEDEIEAEVRRSLFPTLWCCRAALPHMLENAQGSIVNVSSIATRGVNRVPYGAAKGGVATLTYGMAQQLGPHGIRVNAVAPGIIDTPMVRRGFADAFNGLVEGAARRTPLGRLGRAEEVAGLIAYLLSPAAGFVTGALVPVTGGIEILSPISAIAKGA